MRKIIQVLEIFLKYSEVVETNFKCKRSVVEWKLAARKSLEKISYVGVPPVPQLICTNLA